MSDASVSAALRSAARKVLIEAPAGCGKTYQGAEYARDFAGSSTDRLLILTHTHAACSVFADRTRKAGGHVEIRTIDSLITQIAAAYHAALDLPPEVGAWARKTDDGYRQVARRVSALLSKHSMIAATLARHYPTVICDEHQDCTTEQNEVCMAIARQGARMLIFFDSLQRIFKDGESPAPDWGALRSDCDACDELDTPHRWSGGNEALGEWILRARSDLKARRPVDLSGNLPDGVCVHIAENVAHKNLEFQIAPGGRGLLDKFAGHAQSLMVLTRHNATARSLRSFFYRGIPLWEGHTRTELEVLVDAMKANQGHAPGLATAIVRFMGEIGKGFSPSAFGDTFENEVRDRCRVTRKGKPGKLQDLARVLVTEPDHRGVAKVLIGLDTLRQADSDFSDIKIDYRKTFWEAVKLGEFEDPELGLTELTRRRAFARVAPPPRAISTIHKAKGFECESVIVMPCDAHTFPARDEARCLLYVALSRPRETILIVASQLRPSPLLRLP